METEENKNILSLDDIYFKDAFTKTEDKLNFEIDNTNVESITSKNDKFSLDKDGNLIVNSITANSFNIQGIFDMIYPIGCIYTSESDTNPATLFGGVWESVKDRFLLCAGDTYKAGEIGGEASHQLTISEMPRHSHSLLFDQTVGGNINGAKVGVQSVFGSESYIGATGGNKAHNNMPPYQVIYAWKRIS